MRAIRCKECGRRCLSDTDICFGCETGIEPGESRCAGCGALVAKRGDWCLTCLPERDEERAADEAVNVERETPF